MQMLKMPHYELIDSGHGRKLETIGEFLVSRPCPQAIWKPKLGQNDWNKATSEVLRTKDGGGTWAHKKQTPEPFFLPFVIDGKKLNFKIKFTSFGHCGVFFEQISVWTKLHQEVKTLHSKLKRPVRALNLFGYTGCASLVMASAGAEVFHVDSAKGVLDWGKESHKSSPLSADAIKWVHQDAQEFLRHSFKKNYTYDVILADPPSWGHGAKKEVWDYEKHISLLSELILNVITKENSFLLLTGHTPGVQAQALKNAIFDKRWKNVDCGDLGVLHSGDSRILPAGIYASASSY